MTGKAADCALGLFGVDHDNAEYDATAAVPTALLISRRRPGPRPDIVRASWGRRARAQARPPAPASHVVIAYATSSMSASTPV